VFYMRGCFRSAALRGLRLMVVLPLVGGMANAQQLDFQHVIETTMRPYDGPSVPGVAADTLDGKVMCGYQGWFSTPNSPWTVGRYATLEQAAEYADERLVSDLAWCRERDIEYMPVVLPGFQWFAGHPDAAKSKPIPRLHGRFLWEQVVGARRAGASMLYVAMFDEVDEGTAIFKCTNDPPGKEFATFEGDPPDHYLRLVGRAGRLLRGEAVEDP
jgi:hypothetical protein